MQSNEIAAEKNKIAPANQAKWSKKCSLKKHKKKQK